MKADMAQCRRQLEEKEMCAASVPYCEGGSVISFFGGKQYVCKLVINIKKVYLLQSYKEGNV